MHIPDQCPSSIADRVSADYAGRYDLTFTPVGQDAGLLTESRPASETKAELVGEAADVLAGLVERVSYSRG